MNHKIEGEDIVVSEEVSEEMILEDQDKRLHHGTNIDNINDNDVREQFYKYQVRLFIEMIESKESYIEFFPNLDLRMMTTRNGDIIFSELIQHLKRYGFNLDGRFVSYYSEDADMFINCGIEPIHPDITISKDEIERKQLRLRFQTTGQSLIHLVMSEEMNEAVNKMKEGGEQVEQEGKEGPKEKGCRRTKERRIGYIIDKVKKWRDYYNVSHNLMNQGSKDENGIMIRLTLDDAAKKVNISKKSLDDYLLQIRYGRKFGFNFNEHKNEKVGQLRAFVKKHQLQTNKPTKKRPAKKEKLEKIEAPL